MDSVRPMGGTGPPHTKICADNPASNSFFLIISLSPLHLTQQKRARYPENQIFGHLQMVNFRPMMGEGPCCGFTRKTVVMSVLSLSCCMLVLWTIIVTALPPLVEEEQVIIKANTTYPSILAVCPLNSSLPLDRVSLLLTKAVNSNI